MADFQTTVELKAQTGQMTQKLNQTTRQLKQVSTQVRKTQGAFAKMGRKVSGTFTKLNRKIKEHRTAIAGIGLSLGLVVAKGVKDFKEWEDGLAQIATLGVTGIKGISDELDAVRREFGISGAEATKGYYDIISAGAKQGAEAMGQLTAATKLAKAGNTDLAAAIDVVTSGMNIFGDNGETATSIVDQLFLAVKYGKTTVEELGKTFGYVAPVIDAAGLSMADYAASMATITAGGIQTKQATTGLKAVLSNLIKVTPKAAKAAERLGIDFGVAALKSKGLVGVMQDIADKTGGSVTELGMLFDSIEAINAVAVLTSGTGLANLERNFNAMSESAGTTEEALAKVKETASYNFGKFNQGLSIMSRSIGAAVIPSLLDMADALGPVVDFISALVTQHPGIIKITVAVVALGVALAFLGGPITLAIVATGVAIKALVDHFDLFADGGVAALEKIELVWNNFWAGFQDKSLGESINHIFSGIGDWVTTLLPEGGFAALWDTTKTKLTDFWTSVSNWFTTTDWKGLWAGTLEFIGDIWSGVSTALTLMWVSLSKWFQTTDWSGLWAGTIEFVGDIWGGVKTALSYMWTSLVDWFTTTDWKSIWSGKGGNPHADGGVLGFIGDIWSGVKTALTTMWTSLTAWFASVDWAGLWAGTLNFVGDVWAGVSTGLTAMWTSLTEWFGKQDWDGLWAGTLSFVGDVWSGVKTGLTAMWTSLSAWFTSVDWAGLWTGTLDFVGDIWTGVESGLTAMWSSLSGWFVEQDWKGLWAGTLAFAGDIWTGVKAGLASMWTSLTTWFNAADWAGLWAGTLAFAGDIWSGVKSGLDSMWTSLTDWFVKQNWSGLWAGTLAFAGDIWTGIKSVLDAMWTSLTTWFTDVDWDSLWTGTLEFTGDIWTSIKNHLVAMWVGVDLWFQTTDWATLWDNTLEFAGDIWAGVKTALSTMWTGITGWFSSVDWSGLWTGNSAGNPHSDSAGVLGFAGDVWTGVKSALTTMWSSLTAWFANVDWNSLWKGALEFTGKVWDGIKVVLDAAWAGITNWFSTTDWASLWAGTLSFAGDVWSGIKVTLDAMWTSVANWFTTTDWSSLWNNTLEFTGDVWSGLKTGLDASWVKIESWFAGLDWKGVGESVRAGMKVSLTGIGDVFAGVLGEEETIGGDRLGAAAVGVAAGGKIVSKLWPILQKQFAVLSARIAAYLGPMGAGILSGPVGWILLGAVAVGGLTYAFWPQIKSFFTDMWDDLTSWFAELDWGGMWDGLLDSLKNIGSNVVDIVKGWFSNININPLSWFGSSNNASVTDDGGEGRGSIAPLNQASGGFISGDGTGTSDSIPAMLSNGEFVMNAKSARVFMPLLEAMNKNKFAKGGAVGKVIQKYAAGGSVNDAKSYQFLQFEEGLFSMSATIDKFIGNMDATDPAVNKVVRQLEYLQKHTDNLNKDQVLAHDYATRINQAMINLLPKKKEEAEVTSEAAGAVKDLGDAAAAGAEGLAATKNEFEGFGQSFTGPIKQALANGGSIGDAFKQGARSLFQRLANKFLDQAFAPLEKALDEGLSSLFNSLSSQASNLFSGIGGGGGSDVGSSIVKIASSFFGGFMASTGGIVPELGMRPQYFAEGGMAKGTDTVPAMLTPGEMVLNKDQQKGLGGGVTINQTLNITEAMDPQKFQAELLKNNKVVVGLVQQAYQKRGQQGPSGYGQ